MPPRFDTLDDSTGFEVVDPIETRRFTFSTPESVELTPADTDAFELPVSSACTAETNALGLPYIVMIHVRNADGEVITDVSHDASAEFPSDEYLLEINAPLKLYLRVDAGMRIESDTELMRIEFDREATVEVGARSFHESPEATITTTGDPEDVMAAVSTFGSVLKTTTCERSWPTLRGHPPRIERGDELAIPDELTVPDTGVTIEVPPRLDAVYPVAPLAYYFGAEVVAGETPRLTVGGFEHRFDSGGGFAEEKAIRALKRTFFLDCITRTEGLYPVELADRNRLESKVDLDFEALYDTPLDEQLEAYFSVPYSTLSEAMPKWHRITYVRPNPENVEVLPYLINDFSILQTPPQPTYDETEEMRETRDAIDDFKRTSPEEDVVRRPEGCRDASMRRGVPPLEEYVQMPDVDALEQAWVGEGTPIRGTKVLTEAFRHDKADRGDEGVIDITVVCNDKQMRKEWDAVAEVYGSREAISFDVSVHFDVTTDELRALLEEPTDLFHYIGHIDGRGFECPDGFLDANDLGTAGMRAFLLNACRSHDQGVALVESGSHGGIVSLGNVGNPIAVKLGETLAKLFYAGFSIGNALAITRKATLAGARYIAVGDPGFTLAQSDDLIPLMYVVQETDGEQFSVDVHGYPTREHPIGSMSSTYLDDGPNFLSTGPYRVETTKSKMKDVLNDMPHTPVIIDGELVLIHEWIEEQ